MMVNHQNTVDGCEILHQLKTVVCPIIYWVSTIQGGAGFLPSTVPLKKHLWNVSTLFIDVSIKRL